MWFNGLRTNSCKDYVVAWNLLEKKQINLNIERSESEIIWFFGGSTRFMSLLTTSVYTCICHRKIIIVMFFSLQYALSFFTITYLYKFAREKWIWKNESGIQREFKKERKKEWMKPEHTQKKSHTLIHINTITINTRELKTNCQERNLKSWKIGRFEPIGGHLEAVDTINLTIGFKPSWNRRIFIFLLKNQFLFSRKIDGANEI